MDQLMSSVYRFEPRTSLEQVCYPRVPEECPRDDPIEECPTCCCASSENIEFFNPDLPEPVCTAPTTAIYELKFVYTWSEICHPDYYFPDASFTYPTGASHNTVYRMWDACMDIVTIGVGIMSQLGDTSILDQEYLAAGDTILDTAVGEMVLAGVGESSINLTVNAYYQWVSAGLMLFPSVDRMVGVVDLRLCDGDVWKESVKVCLELFSTATASEKIVGEMERNSLQANNCSFGYVEITLLEQFEPTPPEDICRPSVPNECPDDDGIIEECSTCCCASSDNVELYNPNVPEPECTALPALYEFNLVHTWTEVCHPDDYVENSQWSITIVASHDTAYRMWDACMDNVSDGVGLFSQTAEISTIRTDLIIQVLAGTMVDVTGSDPVTQGSGVATNDIVIDRFHQYVSVISRQMPSPDHILGVTDLRLCDGAAWKESVKVCLELFSTATASDRVAADMKRNSVQGNNCSYGYIEFNLLDVHEYVPRTALDEECYPRVPEKCPRDDPIEECPTCCCESSDNVEFYNPDLPEPKCVTDTAAIYKVKFVFKWNEICHPDYYFSNQVFTGPSIVSHNTEYRMWDACMDDASIGVGLLSQQGINIIVEQEYLAAGDSVLEYVTGDSIYGGYGETSRNITVNVNHQWVSAGSMLFPSPDRMVGVADLRLCDGSVWKQSVKVCLEQFSTAAATEKIVGEMERNSLQANNCSFGYIEFNLLSSAITKMVNIAVVYTALVAALFLMN